MKYLSLDASSTCIGWSVWDNDKLIDYGKLKPKDKNASWRDRIKDLIPQVDIIIKKYKVKGIYCEDVPLIKKKGGSATLVLLGAVQGSILTLACLNNIPLTLIPVATWRSNIGLFDGTNNGKERDTLKIHSIQKANELFGIDLNCTIRKSGTYNGDKSDDDIADSILLYASTIHKYCNRKKGFGKGV